MALLQAGFRRLWVVLNIIHGPSRIFVYRPSLGKRRWLAGQIADLEADVWYELERYFLRNFRLSVWTTNGLFFLKLNIKSGQNMIGTSSQKLNTF
jgi:hypothetical protein